ncbi:phosphoribosylaminoimidazolesuccinocarboxamide synthase [Microbacterium sp. cx-55]|uniref:phosphoribosylaminoimidazolesuccinocarboxamide synthase n=1 Tax=Microbacterium sp. cx-55 TaxID=2875948 RepID=UPI001CC0FF62|nr:phosphoribosylaminoimidazolesuccinocarboxamide synthase [Microbacterium sp. cx-55]MBZ4487348.1 phosphoribosylaminoimidazolesuccinocarboxamide synthase [Microbacterium sp. cx-55]UGB35369.1 phosphoribosylaminoimidazolesuccinocarboxamide synthase [Microbacterium sp. cx-55]
MTDALSLPGWHHVYSGKVRDLYVSGDDADAGGAVAADDDASDAGASDAGASADPRATPGRMLVVASDRVSAFDHVLEPGVPGKGELLTTLSLWWFDRLAGADGGRRIPNHLAADHRLSASADDAAAAYSLIPDAVSGRAMVVRNLNMLPVECVVRGYLTGSGWAEYQESGTVCGIRLVEGLGNGGRLPEPIFTPAYKAPMGEHDENISFAQTVELVGAERAAELRDLSLEIYARAAATAEKRGLILADTKFEFGIDADGVLTLADEVLTPDSSRYWDAAAWAEGTTPESRMASFDKQIVRDWLAAAWPEKEGTPPALPDDVVARTAARYAELLQRLTA